LDGEEVTMILITGGGGFIGLNLARDLIDRGQEVLLVRRHPFEPPSFLAPFIGKQARVSLGDIGELPFLYRTIREYGVESIVHAASLHKGTGTLYKALKSNVDGTIELLEAAHMYGISRVTFLSSIAVYLKDGPMAPVFDEDNDLPVASVHNPYIGATKKAGEQICQLYANEYHMSIPIVRPPLVWGPMYQSGLQHQVTMVKNAVEGRATDLSSVYGGTKMVFVYVRDCARAIGLVHLAPLLKHPIYNISDGETHTLADFTEVIREFIPSAQIRLGSTRSATDVDFPETSIERIREDVGFVPEYGLKRAVKAYIDWFRDGKYD
jgi:UDP-glucose 4-epimerase